MMADGAMVLPKMFNGTSMVSELLEPSSSVCQKLQQRAQTTALSFCNLLLQVVIKFKKLVASSHASIEAATDEPAASLEAATSKIAQSVLFVW